MEHFLINSSVCLFSLWLVYKLLLENTSWHQFKRYYFLAAILISAVIPFVVVRTVVVPFTSGGTIDFTTMESANSEFIETGFVLDWSLILLTIYGIGVIIMGARFIKNLYDLRIKTSDKVSSYENYKLVLRELIQIPHSFFGRIYASKTDYQSGAIPDAVLEHEKAHLDQKHSIDILFVELLIVLMWFNPLLYLIKYSIKLNHEFLADQAVLANGVDTKSYQETLLAYSSNSQNRALANTFNFPIIKKRFTIMKTHTTTASGLLRSLAIVPVLALLVISCGQEDIVVEPEVIEIVEEPVDVNKNIMIQAGNDDGKINFNGENYSYKRGTDGMINLFDVQGLQWDYESEGYQIEEIEIVEVVMEESEPFRGKPISNRKKLVSPINYNYTYDLKNNKAISSSIKDLNKEYGNDLIVISEVAKNNGNTYYYAKDLPGKLFLNEYFEVVDLRKLSNGKINLSQFVLPPPPPPVSPLEFIEANKEDLTYYINGKKVDESRAIKKIKEIGQDKVQVLKGTDGKQSIQINTTKKNPSEPDPNKIYKYLGGPMNEEEFKNDNRKIDGSKSELTNEQAQAIKNELEYIAATLTRNYVGK